MLIMGRSFSAAANKSEIANRKIKRNIIYALPEKERRNMKRETQLRSFTSAATFQAVRAYVCEKKHPLRTTLPSPSFLKAASFSLGTAGGDNELSRSLERSLGFLRLSRDPCG